MIRLISIIIAMFYAFGMIFSVLDIAAHIGFFEKYMQALLPLQVDISIFIGIMSSLRLAKDWRKE